MLWNLNRSISMLVTILVFYLVQLLNVSQSLTKRCVLTQSGAICGKYENFGSEGYDVFLGIPYAKPPVGSLRFQVTQPVEQWSEPIDAIDQKPACHQFSALPYPWYDGLSGHDENCLYLNIWVPSTKPYPEGGYPIMFWIHGGGFNQGSIRMDLYNGTALSTLGGVIVVTVNYRLGPLGFLCSNTSEAPGNMGLYDVLEALKWINKNIEYFGGNKNQITLFGESAGAGIIGAFAMSPLTKGLYKRIVMQSLAPAYSLHEILQANLKNTEKLAQHFNCSGSNDTLQTHPDNIFQCLRKIDAKTLTFECAMGLISFLPQYGDDILPVDPHLNVQQERFHNSELLIGVTTDEGPSFFATTRPDIFGVNGVNHPKLHKTMATHIFVAMSKGYFLPFSQDIFLRYVEGLDDEEYVGIKKQLYAAFGDNLIVCPVEFFAEKFADKNSVYFYRFDHRSSHSPWAADMGVTHFSEVEFVFGQPILQKGKYNFNEEELSRRIIQIWSSFAKHGYPDKNWPLYTKRNPLLMVLNATVPAATESGPRSNYCNNIRQYAGFE